MFVLAIASLAMSAYSSFSSAGASNQQAAISQAVGNYNAGLDEQQANQLEINSQQQIRDARADAKVYLSRQTAAYAASGVMVDTGSPLAVKAATAMRLERRVQQAWTDTENRAAGLRSQAAAERMYGASAADMYHLQATGQALGGAAKMIGSVYDFNQQGAFG